MDAIVDETESPYRIVVLHKTGTLGPSGRLGSIPSVGVYELILYMMCFLLGYEKGRGGFVFVGNFVGFDFDFCSGTGSSLFGF